VCHGLGGQRAGGHAEATIDWEGHQFAPVEQQCGLPHYRGLVGSALPVDGFGSHDRTNFPGAGR
jgi:hypothetical protein